MANRTKILMVQPDRPLLRLHLMELRRAVSGQKLELESVSTAAFANSALDEIYEQAEAASLIVVDVTDSTAAAMYLLGYAHAKQKPVLVMYDMAEPLAFDGSGVPAFRYSLESPEAYLEGFRMAIVDALANPSRYRSRLQRGSTAAGVFISYSRKDKHYLERLQVHLQPLQREQHIELWDDTRIQAGQQWQKEIAAALKRCRVAIVLASADYLASDFIVSDELPTILTKAESEHTMISPVIVSPCGFARDPRLKRFQVIHDSGKTLAEMTEVEQERVFDKICQAIEAFGPGAARAASES